MDHGGGDLRNVPNEPSIWGDCYKVNAGRRGQSLRASATGGTKETGIVGEGTCVEVRDGRAEVLDRQPLPAHERGGRSPVHLSRRRYTLRADRPVARREVAGLGPYLQGALMERIDTHYADGLHHAAVNPYSQYVVPAEGSGRAVKDSTTSALTWTISTLDDEASAHLHRAIARGITIDLRRPGLSLSVESAEDADDATEADLSALFYSPSPPNKFRVAFRAPTAFKQHGRYVFLPDPRLVVQSLVLKHSALVDGEEPDEGFVDEVARSIRLTSFRLASQPFPLGGTFIPGFTGSATFGVRGPATLCNYVGMVMRFGEFSGCGIKSSMGMGAIEVEALTRREAVK